MKEINAEYLAGYEQGMEAIFDLWSKEGRSLAGDKLGRVWSAMRASTFEIWREIDMPPKVKQPQWAPLLGRLPWLIGPIAFLMLMLLYSPVNWQTRTYIGTFGAYMTGYCIRAATWTGRT